MSEVYIKEHFNKVKSIIEKKIENGTNTPSEKEILRIITNIEDNPMHLNMLFRILYNKACPLYAYSSYLDELNDEPKKSVSINV